MTDITSRHFLQNTSVATGAALVAGPAILHAENHNSKDNPKESMKTFPKTFSHIGISVPKLEEAVKTQEKSINMLSDSSPPANMEKRLKHYKRALAEGSGP